MNQTTSPRKPSSEGRQNNIISLLNGTASNGFIQGNGHGCRGNVTVFFNSQIDLLERDIESLGHLLKDTEIGLMGNDPLHLGQGNPIEMKRPLRRLLQIVSLPP